ncbi:hypothetical protein FACS1894147_05080 [Spirochaetia bacterium]|nr:hypothetical protein FACS1894147_05080 [Spirochaetia bacterium]
MNNNNTQQTTFWDFLKNHKIEIPVIQRDYAQGRKGKEELRLKFLKDLKNALDGTLPINEKLKLDFVYGSLEYTNENFVNEQQFSIKDNQEQKNNARSLNPLDGQQRLTTLWLLHWFIAYKSPDNLKNNREIFFNFSYETRVSSREFCTNLSEFIEPISNESLIKNIQNQTWFFSNWKQDPTIQSMLNMLNDIEILFTGCNFSSYWEKLVGKDCPIIFYYLDLLGLKLTDDLYIKMNARGKQLTQFENFKADLVGHIKDKGWEENVLPQDTIAHKLDTDWTEIFWKNRSPEYKIDEIYFAFLNRYFLNALITCKRNDKYLSGDYVENSGTYTSLFGKESNDSTIKYTGYDIYNPKEKENDVSDIFLHDSYTRLVKILDNFYLSFKKGEQIVFNNALFLPLWDDKSTFRFIPEYLGNDISTLTRMHRVVFHAICCYFEKGKYDEISLKHWMRVVSNIVENANKDDMIGTMRLIDEMARHSHDIYNFLGDNTNIIKSKASEEQVAEEREKAAKIINDKSLPWENEIVMAEHHAFFKGAIRFLFTDGNGNINWDMFDVKFMNAKKYFDKKGVMSEYQINAILLKSIISKANNPLDTLWWWPTVFNHDSNTWKDLLTNSKWRKAVSSILSGDLSVDDLSKESWHQKLYKTDLLVYIAKKLPRSWIRIIHGHTAIYPSSEGVFLNADHRDNILSQLDNENKIRILYGERIQNTNLFWGWNINFQYNGRNFQWHETEKIYLLDSNCHWVKKQDKTWLCFDTKGKDVDDITKELDNFSNI